MNSFISDFKSMIKEAVKKEPYDGLLFSGGLDTSVLATINPMVQCVTVRLEDKADDKYYSELLSDSLGLKCYIRDLTVDEAIEKIPEVIKILNTFDPAIPNDLAAYFGIKQAKELGIEKLATGDGSDEIFAGYSFMKDLDDLNAYIRRISSRMFFSSNTIAEHFGVTMRQPFIDKEIVDFALGVSIDMKIRKENNELYGKWILRKAFEDEMPHEIAWQSKRPLEYGSGMTFLRKVITDKVTDEEFNDNGYGIKFINKEHLYYYKIYKNVVGDIPLSKENEKECPGCKTGMGKDAFHCQLCGYVYNISDIKEVI